MADTIPLKYAQSLLRLAPVPRDQLRAQLTAANLPLALLETQAVPGAVIPVEDYGRLFIHLVHQLQDYIPENAMDPEDTRLFSAYRMMFQAMLHARDLRQALQRASVYFRRMQSTGETFAIEEDGDLVWCRFVFDDATDRSLVAPENFSMESLHWLPGMTGRILSMAMWHRVCGWFIGSFIDLHAVEMREAPEDGKDYSEVFGQPVKFGTHHDAWAFHSRYLDFPIVQGEPSLETMLATYPAELFRISPEDHSLAIRIRHLIGSDFQRAMPTLQDVAERIHMTTPTLHRRLKEEGTSFQQLKDQCRRDAAINFLASGEYTTAELAELLGFSDSSTFHRAFKKWTGLTPQDYRTQHC
ncbi:AraC family transcriptional regulator [Halioglobus maricola]|uniref:AraC family transcriptional regulator n=1 Tax=Halioglobus maricola TaxID=2601894 RepID=A0A5P9NHU3_9GAMM|nr:AraC family transcriptional regulator [Halioglobus maricola]QFU75105.1 AraC family transcriptional regulator [Halioglobus maricola]